MGTISVAMATFNGSRHLREQLESCVAQSRPPDEIIICDDASTDDTVDVARGTLSRGGIAHRVMVNTTRLGVQRNFQRAIEQASGDIIALADQDDVWLPHKLEVVEKRLRSGAPGAVFSDAIVVGAHTDREERRLWDAIGFSHGRGRFHHDPFGVLLKQHVVTGATLAFRADLRAVLLPLSPAALHDKWIGLILAALGEIAPVDEALMLYRLHEDNVVGVPSPSVIRNARARLSRTGHAARELALFLDVRERLLDLGVDPTVTDRLNRKIAHLRHRNHLPEGVARRAAAVAQRVALGDYSRFSSSAMRAVLFDVMGGERRSPGERGSVHEP